MVAEWPMVFHLMFAIFFQCIFDVVVLFEMYSFVVLKRHILYRTREKLQIYIRVTNNCVCCWQVILTSCCRRWRLLTFIDIVHVMIINCYCPCFVGRDGGGACWGRWQFRQLSASKVRVILIVVVVMLIVTIAVVIVVVMMLIMTIVAMIMIAVSFRGVTREQAGKYRWFYLFCIYFGFFPTAW